MSSSINIRQGVGVSVVKAKDIRSQYLKVPVTCSQCGNKRKWKTRCEYCGLIEKVEDNAD